MHWALADLDTGLFLDYGGKSGWTLDKTLAQRFSDPQSAVAAALRCNVRHPAVAIFDGDPLKVRGYLWVRECRP